MLSSIAFLPFVTLVPPEAAAGVLIYVGYLLLPERAPRFNENDDAFTMFDVTVAIVMGIISIATFSLDKAMAVGFIAYFLRNLARGGRRDGTVILAAIGVVLIATVCWQMAIA